MEILNVEGTAFQANMTVKYVNGTLHSSVWKLNFTEGNVGGWIIIPSNLGVGSKFYDSYKPADVTIEGEEQKIVAGTSRTITHACDSTRIIKEWDKATGVYTYSVEHPKNMTLITTAVATNIWNPQILEINQTVLYALIAVCTVLAVLVLFLVIVVARKRRKKTHFA